MRAVRHRTWELQIIGTVSYLKQVKNAGNQETEALITLVLPSVQACLQLHARARTRSGVYSFFGENGFSSTGMRDIVTRARVPKPDL